MYLKLQKIAHTLPSVKKNKLKTHTCIGQYEQEVMDYKFHGYPHEHDIKIIWSSDLNSEKWWMI